MMTRLLGLAAGLGAALLLGIAAIIFVPHQVRTALEGRPSPRSTALHVALLLFFLTALFIVIVKVWWTGFPLFWSAEIQ